VERPNVRDWDRQVARSGPGRGARRQLGVRRSSRSREDIDWWTESLGRPVVPGRDFGENLTTAGIDLGEAIVGERWRVGTVVLEVSEPRVPCFKLAMRMNDVSFPKKFSAALRTGTYLRIIEEGDLAAGDPIVVTGRPAHGLSIALAARIYLFEHGASARFLEAPQLSEKWRSWASERSALPGAKAT
jgi:MOSC domain-containing protein YiiM